MSVDTTQIQSQTTESLIIGREERTHVRTDAHRNETYIMRIMRDLKEFFSSDIENIQIVPEEEDISVVHALIHGPEKTPYEKGFFYFIVRFPHNYPITPPSVKLMTTDRQRVRFNPNLYACGKVCLSILGTWTGPAWSPANTLLTVLLSIQSLMNEKPYHNEPGFEESKLTNCPDVKKKVENYNEIITHETIRVAVIGMLDEISCDARNMPQVLKDLMVSSFTKNYKHFEDIIKSKLQMTNSEMNDPYRGNRGKYEYNTLLIKLQELKTKFNIGSAAALTDPRVESYSQIASTYLANETRQQNKSDGTEESWEAIIEDMNMEAMDDEDVDLGYSEDSDSDEQEKSQSTQQ